MIRKQRGQAAMEFLMTYGWAILAAIIVIGVLAYFGVFSPGKYATSTGIVSAPLYLNAWNVKESSITLELRNNGAEDINIAGAKVENCGEETGLSNLVQAGDLTNPGITIDCSPTLTEGDAFRGDITITYTKTGSSVDLKSTGSLADKVVAD